MSSFTKTLTGIVAAGAMAVSATPAMAQGRDRGGIDAGDVIAGALVLGGIVAVASAASGRGRTPIGGYGGDPRYGYGNGRAGPQAAIDQCVRAAERTAARYTRGGRAQVTDVRDLDRIRGGYRVEGRIAVAQDQRGRGWAPAYARGGGAYRAADAGRFQCEVRGGRVVDIDYGGIRGL